MSLPTTCMRRGRLAVLPHLLLFVAILSAGCGPASLPAGGDYTLEVWTNDTLRFTPDLPADTVPCAAGDYRLDAGRIRLVPITFPKRTRRCDLTLEVSLRSIGDPWDKSGAIFAFADAAGRDYLGRMQSGGDADTTAFAGIRPSADKTDPRQPALELLRFITPFGVGHWSQNERALAFKPEAVAAWADSVSWKADLTEMQGWLESVDTLWVGAYIDTWSDKGHVLSARFAAKESTLPCDARIDRTVTPLLNTTKLAHDQRPFTAFPDGPLTVDFHLDVPTNGAELAFITTGHGGHAGGDEFVEQPHHLLLDGDTLKSWTPWRNDCAAMRRFNPTSGFWPSTYVVDGDTLEERIASSDLSRSNWCPGDQVDPLRLPLRTLAAGDHTLEIAIPGAQVWTDSTFNFWNIAAWIEAN